ncbi:hypothetical protein ACOCEA_02255 [Maribacter sp. CXY002]|uniref:hypothetical protein n=1 Tax=Maribacter luteocoastalis TaxID=3407671 RepID=UPI003B66D880
MKKISLILVLIVFLSGSSIMANECPEPTKKLTFHISKMLTKDSAYSISEGTVAEVRLSIDSFGKIHILSVDTTNENLEKFIMETVDMKTVPRDSYKLGIVYRIPIEVAG